MNIIVCYGRAKDGECRTMAARFVNPEYTDKAVDFLHAHALSWLIIYGEDDL